MHIGSAIRHIIAFSAFACVACGTVAHAQGTTLDFENLSNPNSGSFNLQGQSVTQNGFTVTDNASGLFSVAPDAGNSAFNYTGSVALFSGSPGATATLTQNNGNVFTINSIDIANLTTQASGTAGSVTVVFTGTLQNGSTVTQTFTHGANDNLETVFFDSTFSNVTAVSFTQDSPFNQFDNIRLNMAAIPESSTVISLALLSIGGIGFARRRRSKNCA